MRLLQRTALRLLVLYYHGISVEAVSVEEVTLPVGRSKGAVACESALCSQIGIDLIERGGNAADAMVGTTLCVGVVGLYHSGIGGGGFSLIRDANGNYETVDFREAAPAAATKHMYRDDISASVAGGKSVAVPGDLAGLKYMHDKYGALPWRAVVNPAAHVARNGFNVTEDMMRYVTFADHLPNGARNFLKEDPSWAEDFAPNGTFIKLGDVMTRRRYADTLEKIGKHGAEIFYEGEIAESIVKSVQETGGIMTMDDMKNYRIYAKEAISIDFRGAKLFSTSAPSSGSVMLSMLKTMEQYDREDGQDVNLTTHRFNEAMRFAYGARLGLGDPDYVSNINVLETAMLSETKAREVRRRILDNTTQPVKEYDPRAVYLPDSHGTSHIVAADASGMVITSTTTVNLLFGAQVMTPDTGIVLNDEMNDFSIPGVRNEFGFEPSAANFIRGGKRPMSSITPLIAEHANGSLWFATGAAGGSRIISATTQVGWHVLEHGMGMAAAVGAPRLHDQLMPDTVFVEWSFDNSTAAGLAERGHNVSWIGPGVSAVQGIRWEADGGFEAVGEPRQKNSGGLTT